MASTSPVFSSSPSIKTGIIRRQCEPGEGEIEGFRGILVIWIQDFGEM